MQFSKIKVSIEEGTMKIPRFQRDFVWSLEKSAALLDSVIKDYPIGSVILWKTAESLRAVKDIGGLKFKEAKEGTQVYYIIDGQQRITSLYAILEGVEITNKNGKKTNYKDVYVDLDADPEQGGDERIVVSEREEKDSERYIALHELLESDPEFIMSYNSKEKRDKIKSYRDNFI